MAPRVVVCPYPHNDPGEIVNDHERWYLVEPEVDLFCCVLVKLLVPVALEVDGIDEHQLRQWVQYSRQQQVLDFP